MENEAKSDESIAQRVEPVKEAPVSPVEQSSAPTETVTTPETTEKPPTLRENYFVEMFDIGEAKNHFEMPRLLSEINDFVLSEFVRQNLDDTIENYKEVVEHYLDKLKLPDGVDQYTRAEKIHELMMIDKKLIQIAKEREELLKKDPSDMTSAQLRKYIEGTR